MFSQASVILSTIGIMALTTRSVCILLECSCYRPQTKFAKIMFLHVSVSPSVHRGEYLGRYTLHPPGQVHPLAGTPPSRYTSLAGTPWQVHHPAGTPPGQVYPPQAGAHPPPEQCMLGDTGNKRAVCILLEYILANLHISYQFIKYWNLPLNTNEHN